MLESFATTLECKSIVSNESHFLIRDLEYGKISIMLILDEIFIINIVYFHFT